PYDTLEEVIGKSGSESGSLKELQVEYKEVSFQENGKVNYKAVSETVTKNTNEVGIQRAKGYEDRPSFTINDIDEMVGDGKAIDENIIICVDSCYGEFVEEEEPLEVGADIIAGSLIKNPGGGLVRAGGYIVGREDLIHKSANRLAAPGLGK